VHSGDGLGKTADQECGGESGAADAPPPASLASRRVGRAKTFYGNHKRSLLLAVALAIVATVAVRLVGIHAPFLQRPGPEGRPAKAAETDAPSRNGFDFALGVKTDARPVDTTTRPVDTSPTASIVTSPEPAKSNSIAGPLPPELITSIPLGLPQGLRDAVVAGSPGAQYELGNDSSKAVGSRRTNMRRPFGSSVRPLPVSRLRSSGSAPSIKRGSG